VAVVVILAVTLLAVAALHCRGTQQKDIQGRKKKKTAPEAGGSKWLVLPAEAQKASPGEAVGCLHEAALAS